MPVFCWNHHGVYQTRVPNAVTVTIGDFAWHADESFVSIYGGDGPNIYEAGAARITRDSHADDFAGFEDIWYFTLRLAGESGILSDASLPPDPPDLSLFYEVGISVQGTDAVALDPGLQVILNARLDSLTKVPDASTFGDYNRDGSVTSADYIVWRNSRGQTGAGLPSDGDGNGEVDDADLQMWRDHFGQSVGGASGSGLAVSVPEPASLVLWVMVCLVSVWRRRSDSGTWR